LTRLSDVSAGTCTPTRCLLADPGPRHDARRGAFERVFPAYVKQTTWRGKRAPAKGGPACAANSIATDRLFIPPGDRRDRKLAPLPDDRSLLGQQGGLWGAAAGTRRGLTSPLPRQARRQPGARLTYIEVRAGSALYRERPFRPAGSGGRGIGGPGRGKSPSVNTGKAGQGRPQAGRMGSTALKPWRKTGRINKHVAERALVNTRATDIHRDKLR